MTAILNHDTLLTSKICFFITYLITTNMHLYCVAIYSKFIQLILDEGREFSKTEKASETRIAQGTYEIIGARHL